MNGYIFFYFSTNFVLVIVKVAHTVKAPLSKTPALPKNMNMEI